MRYGSQSLVLLAVLAGSFATPLLAHAATCTLSPKKLDSGQRVYRPASKSPDWLFSFTEAQDLSVYLQLKTVERDGKMVTTLAPSHDPWSEPFKKAVTREPEKYNAERPFRGMARLGDKQYAFVLDAPEPGGQGYGLLYFDVNGNGDLTDDGVIESLETQRVKKARARAEKEAKQQAEKEAKEQAQREKTDTEEDEKPATGDDAGKKEAAKRLAEARAARATRYPTNHRFPAVDLVIEAGGAKVDYRFFMTAYSYMRDTYGRIGVSLMPGVYREGEIELNGRRQRVVLVDYNSNGRFDDVTSIIEAQMSAKGPKRYFPQRGDVLFLDPKPVQDARAVWDMTGLDFRHNVEKLVSLGGRYYQLKVAPAGDELSIEPADLAMGYVTNPNANYSAILHGDLGLLPISGGGDRPVAVPEGEWKVVSYKIDLTDVVAAEEKKKEDQKKAAEAAKESAEKADAKKPDLGTNIGKAVEKKASVLPGAVARRRQTPRTTLVTAMGTTAGKPVKVVEGQTVALPFGPPYRTAVEASYYQRAGDTLQLNLEIYGSVGEAVTDLRVNGGRPDKPAIKILGPGDEVASEGHFEYG